MALTSTFLMTKFISDSLENQTEVPTSTTAAGVSEGCFIEPQLEFILAALSGSIILVLFITVLVLTCKIIALKRLHHGRHPTSSTMGLKGSGHWSTEQAEEGLVEPSETNLLLEEVQTGEDNEAVQEEGEENMLHQSNKKHNNEENVLTTMETSTSRDTCIDPAKELEGMSLVV